MAMVVPHRILVAPSGFKGSMGADEVAEAIASGIRRVIPGVSISAVPIPDGGEGTARLLAQATGGSIRTKKVTGPVGEKIYSHYALLGGDQKGVAVVEMAAAAGLSLVPKNLRNPAATTTYGVGELINAALEQDDVHTILIGCGDSGTCDGGAGALAALGAKVLDADGNELPLGGEHLENVNSLDLSEVNPRIHEVRLVMALNQHNVLTGKDGVARVFGPQKGATKKQVKQLDAALTRWADVLSDAAADHSRAADVDFFQGPGTGASGGLGAGLAVLGAELTPRFEALIDSGLAGLNLTREIERADLVVTAEGAIDFQTPKGKVPAEIATRAQQVGVPVLALAGTLGKNANMVHDSGIGAIASIIPLPMELSNALENGAELLTDSTERCIRLLLMGSAMNSSIIKRHRELTAGSVPQSVGF
ncbi:glycerate kinase [Rothia sp. LK2588]|uniref:glycerate kinase n=1 Tax=Rothia sp. LK2588 TaxID=3114369 RepID=UPI0034CEF872